jgi:hypothetical protein
MSDISDVIRQMAREDVKLVWYHATGSGKKSLDLVELQTANVRAVNSTSLGFKGPIAVPRELLNKLLELKFIERAPATSDASRSIFHLSDAGRARALETHA